jgi:16S rRNA (cytosine1402-N4)-methyltransferase
MQHTSVLLQESIDNLCLKKDGIYIDATFGLGGHSNEILKRLGSNGRLIAIDRDKYAVDMGKKRFLDEGRIEIVHARFGDLEKILSNLSVKYFDGIIADFGVSSMQLDNKERGFSFRNDAVIDMRMDQGEGNPLVEWINTATEEEIAEVIWRNGEDKFSRKIAKSIASTRNNTPITTTKQLADCISEVVKTRNKKIHPATKTFQAFRIFINQELQEITDLADISIKHLASGGRMCMISFHSLEDKIIKRKFNKWSKSDLDTIPSNIPITSENIENKAIIKKISRIKPTRIEIESNKRSRSAILRVGEKI